MGLLTVGLSGCLAGGGEGTARIPAPGIGDLFVYEGEDGGSLTVTVDEVAPRIDGFQRMHEALILTASWIEAAQPDRPWRFEEAVDPGTGRVVQEIASCGERIGEPDNRSCRDERGLASFYPMGLPGGLGAAPFWDQPIAELLDRRELPGAPGLEAIGVEVQPVETARGACVEVAYPSLELPEVRRLPVFVSTGPVTLCPGIPLPVGFQTMGGATFELADHTAGGHPVPLEPGSTGWEDQRDGVELRSWRAPLVVEAPAEEARPTAREAHRTAMEQDESYRAAIERGALVVSSRWMRTGHGDAAGLIDSARSERSLVAVDDTGRWVRVVVERTESGGNELERRVTERDAGRWETYPTHASLAPQVASLADAVDLGERIIGQPLEDGANSGYIPWTTFHHWFPQDRRVTPDRLTLSVWFEDPSPEHSGGGLVVSFPYHLVVNGATGALEFVVLDRADLPLTEPS